MRRDGGGISTSDPVVLHLSNWGHHLPAAVAETTLSAPTALLQALNVPHMQDSNSLLAGHWSPCLLPTCTPSPISERHLKCLPTYRIKSKLPAWQIRPSFTLPYTACISPPSCGLTLEALWCYPHSSPPARRPQWTRCAASRPLGLWSCCSTSWSSFLHFVQ